MVNDSYGDDMILYKFQKVKALEWLTKKMTRVESFLKKQLLLQKDKAEVQEEENGGAFSSSFRLANRVDREEGASRTTPEKGGKEDELSSIEEAFVRKSAAQIVCEYLSDSWQMEFLKVISLTRDDLSKQKKKAVSAPTSTPMSDKDTFAEVTPPPTAQKRPFGESKMSEADKLMQYTMGSGESSSADKNAKKRKEAEKSVGLKRLSKVNTKGMKSMTSFFGAKAKKK